MAKCCFIEECPEIEAKGGLIFIHSEGRCIAITPHVLSSFIAEAERALERFHGDNAAIVQFRTG